MKVLIAYDSYFGNTEKVANTLKDAFTLNDNVKISRVKDVKVEDYNNLDLLIVGSPTRAFRPTKDVVAFIKQLPNLNGLKTMVFDTRINVSDIKNKFLHFMAKRFGYAAQPMAKGLLKKGATIIGEPMGFFVKDSEGPLKDDELTRSVAWIKDSLK